MTIVNRGRIVPQPKLSSALALLCLILAGPMLGDEHPSLIDPAATKCNTCWADRLAAPVVHPPAKDDCLTCHEFSKDGKKTRVALASPQIELRTMCHGELVDAAAISERPGPVSRPLLPGGRTRGVRPGTGFEPRSPRTRNPESP
jgi:hypothetical protein